MIYQHGRLTSSDLEFLPSDSALFMLYNQRVVLMHYFKAVFCVAFNFM